MHAPSPALAAFSGDASYLGTFAPSRQRTLEALFLDPAARMPERTFVLAGSMYDVVPLARERPHVRHLEPALHSAFFCSSPLTVNVTRAEMAGIGYCPSPRLFEAAACGVPVLSDWFDGLDAFFTPGEEILVARNADEATHAIALPRMAHERMGRRARERALAEHTADARAEELVLLCERVVRGLDADGEPDAGEMVDRGRGSGATAEPLGGLA